MKKSLSLFTGLSLVIFSQQMYAGSDDGFTPLPKSTVVPSIVTPATQAPIHTPAQDMLALTNRLHVLNQTDVAMAAASAKLNQLLQNHPERLIRLKASIVKANRDPVVQGELSDIRKRVRAGIIQDDPQDMDLYEALTAVRQIQMHDKKDPQAIY
jgi:hypothetical protein